MAAMAALDGEYEPSAFEWVRNQVDEYEASGGTRANTLRDTGIPIIVVTMRGAKSGKVRKIALMRVEHDGEYALVASMGGRIEVASREGEGSRFTVFLPLAETRELGRTDRKYA